MMRPGTERRFAWAAGLAMLGLLAVYTVPGVPSWAVDWSYAVVTLGALAAATVACAVRAKAARDQDRWAWGFLAASTLVWGIGEAGWEWLYILDGVEAASPHWTDAFYLANVPLTAAGLLALSWRPDTVRGTVVRFLDGTIIAGAGFLVAWPTFLRAEVEAAGGFPLGTAITLVYPLSDLLILAVLALVLVRLDRARRRALWPLIAGLVVVALADAGFSAVVLRTGGYGTTLIDLGWPAAALGIAWSALRSGTERPARAGPPTRTEEWLPNLALAPPLAALAIDFVRRDGLDSVAVGVALAWGTVVVGRQLLFTDLHVRVSRSLAQAQKLAGLGTWRFDARSRRLLLDDEAARLLGTEAEPDLGAARLVELLDAPSRSLALEAWNALEREGRPFEVTASRTTTAGLHHLRLQGAPHGGLHGTVLDVTAETELGMARLHAEAQNAEAKRLAEVNQFKTAFINTAAHELSTPLTPIRLSLATLRREREAGQPPSGDMLNLLERNVDRLTQLLRDVLDSARLQADRLRLNRQPMDLSALAQAVVEEHQPAANARGVTLEFQSGGPCPVDADATRFHEVAMNLVSNALKFTPSGGRVVVSTLHESRRCRLTVRDTGQGIASADLGRLFQPFSQVGKPGWGPESGTGLGLYIVKGILEQHGGTVGADSAGEGKGATFWVELPASISDLPPLPPAAKR